MSSNLKVTLVGASGGIGQTLSLLLKMNTNISDLALYDVVNTFGVAADLSHVSTTTKVTGYVGPDQIFAALSNADVVVNVAGVPRKPGMTREDLFGINARITKDIAEVCAKACPNAIFLVISNPVNSLVPLFAEVMKKHNVYNPRKLLGVTQLDSVRINTFVADHLKVDVRTINVRVIGGHATTTILPLLSQLNNPKISSSDAEALTKRVQYAGDEVVKAKNGEGSATLSMAFAANELVSHVLNAICGDEGVVENVYTENNLTSCSFFATHVRFGRNGIAEVLPFGSMNEFEKSIFDNMLTDLSNQIKTGLDYIKNHP